MTLHTSYFVLRRAVGRDYHERGEGGAAGDGGAGRLPKRDYRFTGANGTEINFEFVGKFGHCFAVYAPAPRRAGRPEDPSHVSILPRAGVR